MSEDALVLKFPQPTGTDEYRKVFMPYILQPMGTNRWVVLNRRYKPVGLYADAYVDYEPFTVEIQFKKSSVPHLDLRSEAELASECWPHDIVLYNDGCVPTHSTEHMRKHMERVTHLMKLG